VSTSQTTTPVPATPLSPITAILDAFKSYRVVALSEGDHGNLQGHAFRLALVRDPRFARTVNDIVVEFGNSLYQGVMDDFVRGKPFLRTLFAEYGRTQPTVRNIRRADFEEFFQAVRAVNAIPLENQLGWCSVIRPSIGARSTREKRRSAGLPVATYPADLISREVLAKSRRALIYGGYHLIRKRPQRADEIDRESGGTLNNSDQRVHRGDQYQADLRVLQTAVADGEAKPCDAAGAMLGAVDFNVYQPSQKRPWSFHGR
jgi:hypothetical protein